MIVTLSLRLSRVVFGTGCEHLIFFVCVQLPTCKLVTVSLQAELVRADTKHCSLGKTFACSHANFVPCLFLIKELPLCPQYVDIPFISAQQVLG